MSDTPESVDNAHMKALYMCLALLGVDPHDLEINWSDGEHTIAAAVPSAKVGFAVRENRCDELLKNGWYISRIDHSALRGAYEVLPGLVDAVNEIEARKLAESAHKNTSSQEELLIRELLRMNLPKPDRNFVIFKSDGKELTTPDLAWPELKLAFFVDGLWWHLSKEDGKHLDRLVEMASSKDAKKHFKNQREGRFEKDLAARNELQMRGWTVMACTDRDIDDKKSRAEKASEIARMIRMLQSKSNESDFLEN